MNVSNLKKEIPRFFELTLLDRVFLNLSISISILYVENDTKLNAITITTEFNVTMQSLPFNLTNLHESLLLRTTQAHLSKLSKFPSYLVMLITQLLSRRIRVPRLNVKKVPVSHK